MQQKAVYAFAAVFAAGVLVLASRSAVSAGQSGALVRLQPTTPGAAQTGHVNVDGTALFTKVGIGESAPGAPLTVGSGNKFQVAADGSVRLSDPLASIWFASNNTTNDPMIEMFSGPGSASRMVLAHSPSFTNWGLEYQDSGDKFNFMGAGTRFATFDLGNNRVGIGTTSPTNILTVAGGGQTVNFGTADEGIVSSGGLRSIYGLTSAWDPNSSSVAAIIGENTNGSAGVGMIGKGNSVGVYGLTSTGYAVYGLSNFGRALFGVTSSGYGVYGRADNSAGYGGYFEGKVHVAGTLSKSSGAFLIDDPRDPENRYLMHSFVESPDMMNVYNGVVTTDEEGYASVQLPSYFQTLNKDYRYQLTVIGGKGFALAKIEREVENNMFTIRTNEPNVRVSWQVTGIRQDPWAEHNRIVPEQEKPERFKGTYLNPDAYGQPESKRQGHDTLQPGIFGNPIGTKGK